MPTLSLNVNSKSPPGNLVRFSTGQINPDAQGSLKFKCYSRKRKGTDSEKAKAQLEVRTEINGISFCGKNYGNTNFFQTDACDYYVGIRKMDSNKVNIIPANLFRLEPDFTDITDLKSETNEDTRTIMEQKNDLIVHFGSGKMQKVLNKRLKEKLDKEMMNKTTEVAVKKITNENLQLDETTDSSQSPMYGPESSVLPPHDRNATQLENVYKLDDILPPGIRQELNTVAEELIGSTGDDISTWRDENKYFDTVLTLLLNRPADNNAKILHCQCLVYLQYLQHLYRTKSDQLRSKVPLPTSWNDRVRDFILNKFTLRAENSHKRLVPSRMRDLQISYIMVLYLHLNNFVINLNSLSLDLKIPVKKLQTHAQALGCKVNSKDKQSMAVLQFPLKFPDMKAKRGKAKIF